MIKCYPFFLRYILIIIDNSIINIIANIKLCKYNTLFLCVFYKICYLTLILFGKQKKYLILQSKQLPLHICDEVVLYILYSTSPFLTIQSNLFISIFSHLSFRFIIHAPCVLKIDAPLKSP